MNKQTSNLSLADTGASQPLAKQADLHIFFSAGLQTMITFLLRKKNIHECVHVDIYIPRKSFL